MFYSLLFLNYILSKHIDNISNPTSREVIINSTDKIISITIYNIMGNEIMYTNTITNNKLDLSELNNGIYFIDIKRNNEIITKKLIL